MPAATVTIPLHCGHCGRRVTVEYVPEALSDFQSHPLTWQCPHAGCLGANLMGGVRTIVAVWTEHRQKPV